MNKIALPLATLLVLASAAQAQVLYSTAGATYSENFDAGLTDPSATSTFHSNTEWSNNTAGSGTTSGMVGWYFANPGAFDTGFTSGANARTATELVGTGSFASNRIFSLAASGAANVADNSLGLGTGSTSTPTPGAAFGVRITNSTGAALNQFTLSYTGQQWLRSTVTGALDLYYYVAPNNAAPTAFGTGGLDIVTNGTLAPSLGFTALHVDPTAATLNGTLAENSATVSGTITGLNWANDTDLYLVWRKSGTGAALAIDDLAFTASAIPEPSAFAALAGLGALGLAASRRRRRG